MGGGIARGAQVHAVGGPASWLFHSCICLNAPMLERPKARKILQLCLCLCVGASGRSCCAAPAFGFCRFGRMWGRCSWQPRGLDCHLTCAFCSLRFLIGTHWVETNREDTRAMVALATELRNKTAGETWAQTQQQRTAKALLFGFRQTHQQRVAQLELVSQRTGQLSAGQLWSGGLGCKAGRDKRGFPC